MGSWCSLRLVVGLVVAVNVCGLGVRAQTVPVQGERYKIETVDGADGRVVTITDVSQVPITAFRAGYVCGDSHKVVQLAEDTVILGMGAPHEAKNSLTFALPPEMKECPGGVDVIAFADGQHVGDAAAWKRLVVQRSAADAEVSGLLSVAEGMSAKEWTMAGFLAQVEARQKAVEGMKMGADERRGRSLALEVAREGFGLDAKRGAGSWTETVSRLIKWMTALEGALGAEKVGMGR
jgi:hypothetical protein